MCNGDLFVLESAIRWDNSSGCSIELLQFICQACHDEPQRDVGSIRSIGSTSSCTTALVLKFNS